MEIMELFQVLKYFLKVPCRLMLSISTYTYTYFFTALPAGATIVLSSTVSPGFVSQLEQRLLSTFVYLLRPPMLLI